MTKTLNGKAVTLVFVYGTLKTGGSNHGLMGGAELIGEAITVGDHFTMLDGGYPYTFLEGICRIKGELFSVEDDATLTRLDRLEGHPDHFMRYPVQVRVQQSSDGETYYADFDCFMYVASRSTMNYLKERGRLPIITPDDNGICEWLRQWPERAASKAHKQSKVA